VARFGFWKCFEADGFEKSAAVYGKELDDE